MDDNNQKLVKSTLSYLFKSIAEQNLEKINNYLDELNISNIQEYSCVKLLSNILSFCKINDKKKALNYIFEYYDEVRPDPADVLYKSKVFLFENSLENLVFALASFFEHSQINIISILVKLGEVEKTQDNVEALDKCINAFEQYAEQNPEKFVDRRNKINSIYELLIEHAEKHQLISLENAIKRKLASLSDYKDKPDYVYNFIKANKVDVSGLILDKKLSKINQLTQNQVLKLDLTDDYKYVLDRVEKENLSLPDQLDIDPDQELIKEKPTVKLPTDKQMVDQIIIKLFYDSDQETKTQIRNKFIEYFKDKTLEFKQEYYREHVKIFDQLDELGDTNLSILTDDLRLFRLFGPKSNVDKELDEDNSCAKLGCRMLICNCNEGYDIETDFQDEYVDWFTGECEYCFTKLKSKAHAVREPSINGGWSGCYCSYECFLKNQEAEDLLLITKIKIVLNSLKNYGLQDRINRV